MKTLDAQWREAKRAYDAAKAKHGPRSIRAKIAQEQLAELTKRILRKNLRRVA